MEVQTSRTKPATFPFSSAPIRAFTARSSSCIAASLLVLGGVNVQGYLAHKKLPRPGPYSKLIPRAL